MVNHPNRSRRQTLLRQLSNELERVRETANRWAPGTCYHTRAINCISVLERKIAATKAEGRPGNWINYSPDGQKVNDY